MDKNHPNIATQSEKRGHIRERILRVLLNHSHERLSKYRIVKNSGANISWVIEFLKKLEKLELVKDTKVRNYKKTMHFWHNIRKRPEFREYMIKKPLEILKKTDLQYALTTYQAENLVQKYLFPSRIDFYINPKDKEKWHRILAKEGLVGKGNTRVLIEDAHVFYNIVEKNGLHIVSMPQLIVDLLFEGGVCTEAAEMLIEKEEERFVSRKRD